MDNILRMEERIYTRDLMGGRSVYGEKVENLRGAFYREWIPWRSKMASLLKKRADVSVPTGNVLYLGAAQGTTVSHLSDADPEGIFYAVEFSETPFRKLSKLAKERGNIVPIMEDANHPERYQAMIPPVDWIYQDVSQKDQAGILLRNSGMLKPGGRAILMVKARSVDVTSSPERVFEGIESRLAGSGLEVTDRVDLSPFQKDHAAILLRKPTD